MEMQPDGLTRRRFNRFAIGGGACALAGLAHAQEAGWPTRPLRVIVSWAAGGATDTVARSVTRQMSEFLGQPIIVDNRPGAAGLIGTELVAAAEPDGYTLLIYVDGNGMMPVSFKNIRHDPVKSFAPISILGRGSMVLIVHPSFPATTLAEFIAYGKAHSQEMQFATPGRSTPQHLAFERLRAQAGFAATHVPYKGGAQAIVDVVGGQVKIGLLGMASALPHIRAGRLKALAITGHERSPLLPDVPTVAEAALPGFEMVQWQGLVAPAGTPAAVLAQLHAAALKAMKTPDVVDKLATIGMDHATSTSPREFAQFIARETARWPALFKAAGIEAE